METGMKVNKILFVFFIILPFILPASGFCELKAMNDDELLDVYAAAGFATFTIEDSSITESGYDEAKAWFNIRAYTYTEIDSLKLGYHDEYDYKDPTPGFNWDEDWVDVQIGKIESGSANDDAGFLDPTEDFYARGFYFTAAFTDIDTPATRELKTVKFGFDYVQGDIKANFLSYSGTIDDSNNNTPEYNGHRLNLGPVTITADPLDLGHGVAGGMEISLNIENYDKGYWVTFDNAVVTP